MSGFVWSPALTWGVFGLMALVALFCATMPLWRRPRVVAGTDRLTVYSRQLQEIAMEEARGLLTPDAAQAARLEVERRILRLAEPQTEPSSGGKTVMAGMGIAAVAGAFGLYFAIGQPGYPDHPAEDAGAVKLDVAETGASSLNALLDKLITYLDDNPDAMEGWTHLRRAALSLGREADYSAALSRGVTARPDDLDLRVLYAESLVLMGKGQVSPAARLALLDAAAIDPRHPAIGYYSGMALMQDNKPAEAEALWQALLASSPPDAEWRGQIIEKIAEAEAAQGKSGDDAAAAIAALPADEQQQQIRGMVEGLAARMDANPEDADGWLRLGRAWRVLGETDKARAALGRGLEAAKKSGKADLQAAIEAETRLNK